MLEIMMLSKDSTPPGLTLNVVGMALKSSCGLGMLPLNASSRPTGQSSTMYGNSQHEMQHTKTATSYVAMHGNETARSSSVQGLRIALVQPPSECMQQLHNHKLPFHMPHQM
jgi:hypothetical protein